MAVDRPTHDEPPPSAEELAAAESLRDALADPSVKSADADLARAVALSHEPRAIDPEEHRAIVARGIDAGMRRRTRARGVVIRVTFGIAAVVALAAGVVLVVGRVAPPATALAVSRSTQPLFSDPFPKMGSESSRVDRIAMARGGDLRDNEFARWGVSSRSAGRGR
jgi:hypothetical protein